MSFPKSRAVLLCTLLLLTTTLRSQQEQCGTDALHQATLATDPNYAASRAAIEAHRQLWMSASSYAGAPTGIIQIPVVFHVVYKNVAENLSTPLLQSQIDVLNEDFRRTNPTASQTPAVFQGVAADVQIEFCLATFDPFGNPTSGITRTSTTVQTFSLSSNNVKSSTSGGADPWPYTSYLNIWVCDLTPGLLGYAAFPGGPANLDGIVLDYSNTGRPGSQGPPYNQGRTASHEVGHWLDLRHMWGNGPGGCASDDLVADTPNCSGPNSGCATPSTCGSLDMTSNYMDYTDDACMNIFTLGQKTRMRTLFAPGGFRRSLLNSFGCTPPPPPDYQINQPESTLTIDNVSAGVNSPAITNTCASVPVTLSWSSTTPGLWEVIASASSLIPASSGAITTPGGQFVNVNVFHPTTFFFNSAGLNPLWTPFPGNANIPVDPGPLPYTLSAQQVILNAALADGFALSQAVEMRVNTGGPPPSFPLGPVENDGFVPVALFGSGTNCGGFLVPFYGTSYQQMFVSSNGGVPSGTADSSPQANAAAATAGPPFVGLWADLDPSQVGSISISSPTTGTVRVDYTGLEYRGQPFSTSSFGIEFDSTNGDVTIDGLTGVIPNNASQFIQDMLLGMSPGSPHGILSPNTLFTPGSSGSGISLPGGLQLTLFDYCATGYCSSLTQGIDRIIFSPTPAGNYNWLAF